MCNDRKRHGGGIGQLSSTRRETGRGGRAGKTIGTPVPGSGWTRDGGDRVASLEKFAATAFNAARGDGRPAACPLPLANGIELPNDLTRAKTTQPVPEPCGGKVTRHPPTVLAKASGVSLRF